MTKRTRLFEDDCYWVQIKDGNADALNLFKKHYSFYHYKDGRTHKRFVGPGHRIVLIGKHDDAIFVWRKFRGMDDQQGINCSIFRNESKILSSELILQAEQIAWKKWPGERLYTYVNPRKIKSVNPGFCFKKAGWQVAGITKRRKLLILFKTPT